MNAVSRNTGRALMEPEGWRAGFTLVEVLTAVALGVLVLSGLMTMYIWLGRETTLAHRIAWSHIEALKSGREVVSYLRNASELVAMDTNTWKWIVVRMPDGSLSRLVYENPISGQRDGYMYLSNSVGHETIVARGMTEIMSDGYSPPVFRRTGPSSIRISYRLVEPVAASPGEIRDSKLGAIVDTGVYFRNGIR